MHTVLRALTRVFDLLLWPFAGMPPLVGLLVVSVVSGVVMLIIFGKTSNQGKISAAKDKLKAYIMEMWIFRNEPRVMFRAIFSIARHNLGYLRHSLVPIAFLLVPVVLIMIQLGIRYASAPLAPGEAAVITVDLQDGVRASTTDVQLVAPEGVELLTPALRIDATGEIDWKVRMAGEGSAELVLETPDGPLTKSLEASPVRNRTRLLSSLRPGAGTWNALLYPVEPPIPSDSVVRSIRVGYPDRDLPFLGWNLHWLVVFFVVSVVAGFALKDAFGIEV